jgi:alkaline phosphatase
MAFSSILRKILVFFLVLIAGMSGITAQTSDNQPQGHIKYVFLFIGDGMGLAEVNLTEAYGAALKGETGLEKLNFTAFPNVGLVSTYANDRLTTCSAAAGTALATGHKTNIGRIGMDSSGTVAYYSVATKAKEAGFKIGDVTTVSINHATPAAFYAHQPDRDNYFEIGQELAKSNFNFFAGGGFFIKDTSKAPSKEQQAQLIQKAKNSGYKIISSRSEMEGLTAKDSKVLVLSPKTEDESSLPYSIDADPGDFTLADYTAAAIKVLDNEDGFFVMIEGGKIDWAGHGNDAGTLVQEVLAFDQAIDTALEFYKQHPDETLIVVTADHETGGLALGNEEIGYETNFGILKYQKSSEEEMNRIVQDFKAKPTGDTLADFNRMLKALENDLGLNSRIHGTLLDSTETADLKTRFYVEVYGKKPGPCYNPGGNSFMSEAVMIMNNKAGISWGTGAHTAINVPIYAIGPCSELFSGYIDNTDIPKIIGKLMGLPE